jgi:type VI protein secretion system component Hcp
MPDTTYMKVDEITGPVGVDPYTGWFELLGFSPISVGEMQEGHVWKETDSASPLLNQLASSGQLREITIAAVYSKDNVLREKWRATYKDALVFAFDKSGRGGLAQEHIGFTAQEVALESPTAASLRDALSAERNKSESLADWFGRMAGPPVCP